MQNSSKTNCSKAEITGKNYKANRTLRVRIISKSREPLKIKGSREFFHPRDVNVMLKLLFSTYSIQFAVFRNRCINHKLIKIF